MKIKQYSLSLGILLVLIAGNIMAGAKFAPVDPAEFVNLAWSLSTNSNAAQRNGALAVKYAEKACRQTAFGQPTFVGVLAAAYAENGRFNEAISMAQYASNLAAQNGDNDALKMSQGLLQLFMNHQPYHDPAPAHN